MMAVCMDVTLHIPDDLADRLGGNLSRRVLELLALDGYKNGHLTSTDLRGLLGFHTAYQLDEFLEAHNLWADYTVDDFLREIEDLQHQGP
jgi:hypothetical protein